MSMAQLLKLVIVLELDLVVRPMEYGLMIWRYYLQVCEFEIVKVACWLNEKYSNLFEVELIAKDVKVRKLVWVKSKYEMEGN